MWSRFFSIVAISVVLASLSLSALAGPYEDAKEAKIKEDYKRALELFMSLAEEGDAEAQHELAGLYYNGFGVQQDYAEAAKWYRKAAEQNHLRARYNLGKMYENGEGVKQDYIEAYLWFYAPNPETGPLPESDQTMININGKFVPNLKKARMDVTAKMTPEQQAEAEKRMASEWR